MDTNTGQIYRNLSEEQWQQLRESGQPVVPVSERVADAVEIGMEALNRAERRALKFRRNRNREPQARPGAAG